MKATHYLGIFESESEEYLNVFTGSKKECKEALKRLAALLGMNADDTSSFDDDIPMFVVRPAQDAPRPAFATVERDSQPNPFGNSSQVMVCYTDEQNMDDDDRVAFTPVHESKFKAGDQVVFIAFHPNIPGGWTFADKEFTHTEYWQC